MSEIITCAVEKMNEYGQLKTDSIRLTELDWKVGHTVTCREGALCVQHCNLIIEVTKLEDIKQLGGLEEGSSQRRIVYDSEYSSPTLQAAMGAGGGNVPLVTNIDKLGNVGDIVTQGRSVYNPDGIAPTLLSGMSHGNTVPYVTSVVVQKCGDRDKEGSYSVHDYSNCIPANPMSDRGQMLVEQTIVASRGRNPENPSDRSKGTELEQRLEINNSGCTNTLTTVQKDNMVLESQRIIYDDYNGNIPKDQDAIGTITQTCGFDAFRNGKKIIETSKIETIEETKKIKIRQATKQGFIECEVGGVCCLEYPTSTLRRTRTIENGQISPTITTESVPNRIEFGNPDFYNFLYEIDGEIYLIRIRKLIPLECWRLMGFTDEDYKKAEQVNSNTQLYKQAGNSIVCDCLEAIFSQMNIEGVTPWNERIKEIT